MSVWNPVWPNGAVSVRANTIPGQQNTNYINSIENVNHYWNVGANFDGNHRFIQMPNQAIDVALTASMDGALYIKPASVNDPSINLFYVNATGIVQATPTFQKGSVSLPSSSAYVNVGAAIPQHSYGVIYMFTDDDVGNMAMGFFVAGTTTVNCYTNVTLTGSMSGSTQNVRFGNGSTASGLIIRAQRNTGLTTGPYQYRIYSWVT